VGEGRLLVGVGLHRLIVTRYDTAVTSELLAGRRIGRYVLFDELASGGMATVHCGRLIGPAGFARTVAIKRLHAHYAKDPEFVAMFLDEARLAARVRHPNVVPMLDIVTDSGEMLLVMEYVDGLSLSVLLRTLRAKGEAVPPALASAVLVGALTGLHAAHEATSEHGGPLHLVHRDVSPQNILVGADGVVRVADFGIAKAVGRLQTTREGYIKGKSSYMSPEQIRGREVDRRADVYAAGVVLWEMLTGSRLFAGETPLATMNAVLEDKVRPPSDVRPDVPRALDAIVMRALSRTPRERFGTAREMAMALEGAVLLQSPWQIGAWVEATGGDTLKLSSRRVREIETLASPGTAEPSPVGGLDLAPRETREDPTMTDTVNGHVSEIAARRRPRRATIVQVALAAALLPSLALGLVLSWRGHDPSRAAATGVASSEQAAASQPTSVPLASPVVPPAASSTAAEPPPPDPIGPATRPVRARVSAPPAKPRNSGSTAPSDTERCTPPYTVDASGVKHWKPGC
jgi:eukaryotic-like serine/threonine-protein kinase